MAATLQIPAWVDDESSGDWNTAVLGDAIIPGIVSVEDLEVGIDVDHKKAHGSERPTSTDNGLRPSKWKLRVHLNKSMWPDFQIAAQSFQPRRPGRERQPLQIIRPEVNFLGITECRVSGIKLNSPTAKGGMVIHIMCEEWFDKPVAVKKKESAAIPANGLPIANSDALDRARVHALNLTRRQATREMNDELSESAVNESNGGTPLPSDNLMEKTFTGLPL